MNKDLKEAFDLLTKLIVLSATVQGLDRGALFQTQRALLFVNGMTESDFNKTKAKKDND